MRRKYKSIDTFLSRYKYRSRSLSFVVNKGDLRGH